MRGASEIGHYESNKKEIVRLLQRQHEWRNLAKYAVVPRSGVFESMLSLVERGLRNPTMELMLRNADGTGANLLAIIEKATRSIVRGKTRKAVVPRPPARSKT